MNIGIDIDDTLTNSHEVRLAYGQKFDYEKLNGRNLVDSNAKDTLKMFNWSEKNDFKLWFEEGLQLAEKSLPPRPFAKEIIEKLWQEGHKIYIVTSRNEIWFKKPFEESKEWLEKNEIRYDKLILDCSDKAKTCAENNIKIFLDDDPKYCLQTANIGIKTFIFNCIYNNNFKDVRIKHIYSWIHFYYEIKKLLKE